jgi:SAM-dependent methyltransferase
MRITYRNKTNLDYWTKRWGDIEADEPMENKEKYPLKYSILTIKEKKKKILEAGCGAGRILRYYHNNGYKIIGFDFVKEAINKLKKKDNTLDVRVGNIAKLEFESEVFDYILAFGLYHNLENDLNKAIIETSRVLKKGGYICASFRADNIQNRIVDFLRSKKNKNGKVFHKLNLTKNEFINLFTKKGFIVKNVYPVENMPFLYKFSFFRAREQKKFDESLGRKEGYKFSFLGKMLQRFLISFFPNQFCNIYVLIAKKK